MMATVRTTCPYCGVGCGVRATPTADEPASPVAIEGDPLHPANRGALCSKGRALGETLALEGRLLQPQLHGAPTDWESALEHVAQGFARTIAEHGPGSVALYVSGQLLTEDYYVANKLMKGYVGTANIDTNSRLCMASAVAAHKRAFGEDLVPVSYEDIDLADLVVLVGSNTAWCHPVLYQRIVRAREARPGMKVVVIDPRRTSTCDIADLHLPVRAGTDTWLFNGLLAWLAHHGHVDAEFVVAHTRGYQHARVVADNTAGDLAAVARRCAVDVVDLQRFYEWFAATPRTLTMFSQGVNQSSSGTDKANSIINAHLATGRIGQPGMGPFSLTGQPNAMGGREVGGLSNTLAAHLELESAEDRARVQSFWRSPTIATRPGLKAVDLFEAVHAGQVRAIWIMGTNPVVSLPDANRVREALRRCDLVVVSDCVAHTDTSRYAHVLLPAAAWGEKDGTVTNSDRHISRQRAFRAPPGGARPDWWAVCQVAQRMGHREAFAFDGPAAIFAEHAALSRCAAEGRRHFDIGGLAALDAQGYEALEPVAWPVPSGTRAGTQRLFGDRQFAFADGRARIVAVTPREPAEGRDEEFPLALNTGRIRDQWHTMTRSGCAPSLASHMPEPFADLHPQDALAFGLRAGELVRVATRWGRLVARLRTSGEVRRGSVFVPIHWSGQNSSDARVGALVNPAVDPVSGEPEFKHTPARVEPFVVAWHGFAISRRPLDVSAFTWWTHVQGDGSHRYELAGRSVPGDWSARARALLGAPHDVHDWSDLHDAGSGVYRGTWVEGGALQACLFIAARADALPAREWLGRLCAGAPLGSLERSCLLMGRPADPSADVGPAVCSCFNVGRNTILQAIDAGCQDPKSIGARIKAGTNCGSCVPELRRLIAGAMQDGPAAQALR
ncbi:MAG: Nitrate reductase [Pseudomonadota bacterium]